VLYASRFLKSDVVCLLTQSVYRVCSIRNRDLKKKLGFLLFYQRISQNFAILKTYNNNFVLRVPSTTEKCVIRYGKIKVFAKKRRQYTIHCQSQ